MKEFYILEDLLLELKSIKCLTTDGQYFYVSNSPFIISIFMTKAKFPQNWLTYTSPPGSSLDPWRGYLSFSKIKKNSATSYEVTTFEQMIDELPDDARSELMFHLDLFLR